MATVPSARSWSANEDVTSTNMNSGIRDPINFLMEPPIAELRQTAAQSLTTSTWTSITFGVEDVDNDFASTGGHSTVTNTSRYTAVYAGWYFLGGGVAFASNATGIRATRWAINGSAVNGSQCTDSPITGNPHNVPGRGKFVFLAVGDYVELQGFQSSGGALNTAVSTDSQSSMSVGWKSIA